MNRKFIFIIIPLVALILIGGGIIAWVLLGQNNGDDTSNGTLKNLNINTAVGATNSSTVNTNAAATNSTASSPLLSDPSSSKEAVALSRSFTERFGSYSSQNNFENINDLRIYMTDTMKKAADKIIADSTGSSASYSGITTQVLSTDVTKEAEKRLEITVVTQRQETSAEKPETNIFQQNAELVIVLQENAWLVDSFNWK